MMPVVFRVPLLHWDVPGYGLVLMLGFLLSVIWAARRAARSGASPDVVLNCAFIALLGGVGGARLMHVVHYWDQFRIYDNWLAIVIAILDVRKGGLEVYGGVITAIVGTVVYLALARHSIRWYLDIMAPSTALGMGLGRIGCFLNGCCWGTVCDLPWAVRFPFGSNAMAEQWYAGEPGMDLPKELIFFPPGGVGADGRAAYPIARDVLWATDADITRAKAVLDRQSQLRTQLTAAKTDGDRRQVQMELAKLAGCSAAAAASYASIVNALDTYGLTLAQLKALARQHPAQPVHPTQFYSTIMLVLLVLLLNTVYWRRTRDGQVICTMLVIEPWTRYVLELLRADNPLDTLGFTVSQFLAIVLSTVGLLGFVALRFLPARSPRAKLSEPPDAPPPRAGQRARQAPTRA